MQLALQHHRAGRFSDAERMYHEILRTSSNEPAVCNLLGVLYGQVGRGDQAIEMISKAISIDPQLADAHYNLGIALQQAGRLQDAADSFQRTLELKPDHTAAANNLGTALMSLERWAEAESCYRKLLSIRPNYAETHYNLGLALREQGHLEDAQGSFSSALRLNPDYAEAQNNLGNVLKELGDLEGAEQCYRGVIAKRPNHVDACYNLGIALAEMERPEAAIECYRHALRLRPDDAEVYRDLGVVFKSIGNMNEALECFQKALALKPDFTVIHTDMAGVYRESGKLDDAVASHRRVVKENPDDAGGFSNLGTALVEIGELDEGVACYAQALAIDPDLTEAHSNLLFAELYRPGHTHETVARLHAKWDDAFGAKRRVAGPEHPNSAIPDKRLRIGWVSPNFGRHPVGYFIIPVLENLPKSKFEMFAYNDRKTDDLTERIKATMDVWRDVRGIPDDELTETIRADEIDILIDLAGHTGTNRMPVFARKPAPVQIAWAGYAATTGLSAIDYLISDRYSTRAEEEKFYSETVVRMPDGWLCYEPPQYAPDVGPLPCLETGFVTFGSFSNPVKINDAVVALWADILAAIPNSTLMLKYRGMTSATNRQRISSSLASRGIDAARLILEDQAKHSDFLASYNRVDVALDPFPYSGGLTTLEALWMGVPVITMPGETFASRHSLSFLATLGLSELIGENRSDYIERAVQLAEDQARLAGMRQTLRDRVAESPICDGTAFAEAFSEILRGAWRDWCGAKA
jgi:protein O-GlcNAc transferase